MSDQESSAPPNQPKTGSRRNHDAILAATGILIALVTLYITEKNRAQDFTLAEKNREQELNLKYVEIAVAVLRADPKEENAARIRPWAARILKKFSPEALTSEEFEQLIEKKIKAEVWEYLGSSDASGGSVSAATGAGTVAPQHEQPAQFGLPKTRRSK